MVGGKAFVMKGETETKKYGFCRDEHSFFSDRNSRMRRYSKGQQWKSQTLHTNKNQKQCFQWTQCKMIWTSETSSIVVFCELREFMYSRAINRVQRKRVYESIASDIQLCTLAQLMLSTGTHHKDAEQDLLLDIIEANVKAQKINC